MIISCNVGRTTLGPSINKTMLYKSYLFSTPTGVSPPKKGSNNVVPAKAGIFWPIASTHFILEDPRLCGDDEIFFATLNSYKDTKDCDMLIIVEKPTELPMVTFKN